MLQTFDILARSVAEAVVTPPSAFPGDAEIVVTVSSALEAMMGDEIDDGPMA